MSFFGSGKKKAAGPSELVLAYLEDAQRVRSPFLLQDSRKIEVQAALQGLDEDANTATFQLTGPFAGTKGSNVNLVFILENLRIGGRAQIADIRGTTLILSIPEELELMERRKQPRARLNAKEGATATALTGLFEGIGVNGTLESISESGCRLRVEKALNIKDEKRLPLGTALMSPGQAIMLLKLNKLPKCPAVMELSGRLAYFLDSPGGLLMAIVFEKPKADVAAAIRALVSSRSSALPSSLPAKIRRKAMTPEPPQPARPEERTARARSEETPSPERPPQPKPPEPKPPDPDPAAGAASPSPVGPPRPAAAIVPDKPAEPPRNAALQRLKKRTRTVILMTSPGYGELFKAYLMEEGYGRVIIAANAKELEDAVEQAGVAMVIIDSSDPVLESLQMVTELHETHPSLPPFILAAEDVSRTLVLAAHRAGISQFLVKPYALDENLSAMLEQQMGFSEA